MRLTWSTMLQHNNNNNHPCLKASPHEAPLKRPPRPLPGRLELGLGDLPLIRGLRAWVLCSKNRQKADGRAPATPPAARRTSCPRPADVRFGGGDWGSGYGLPGAGVGAGVGALVTVATLQTSEGAGKTQTRCLFLRNDKGTCLYSTSGGTGGPGGWPRGKPGPGRRDPSALQTQTAASRGRLRSGRRWRKSGHPGVRDKRQSDEDVAREQEKAGTVPKGGSSRKHPGLKGLQNPSDVDSPGKETIPDEDDAVKRKEPDQVGLDYLASPQGESCQKSQRPEDGLGSGPDTCDGNCPGEYGRTADRRISGPEKPVTENRSENVQLLGGPDQGFCQKNGFQKSSNEGSSPDKGLSYEEVPETGEDSDKVSPDCLQSPKGQSSQKRQPLEGSPGSTQKKCPHFLRIPEQVSEKKQNQASPDLGFCKKTGAPVGSRGGFHKASIEGSREGTSQDKRPTCQEVPDTECEDLQSPKERMAVVRTPFDDITPAGWRDEDRRPAGGGTEQAGVLLGNGEADLESEKKPTLEFSSGKSFQVNPEADGMPEELLRQSMGTGAGARLRIPTPCSPPSGTMATGQQRVGVEEEEKVRRDDKEQEEDDFGGFVQADGEDGSPEDLLLSETAASGGGDTWPDWEPAWTGSPDAWATFPRDEARDWAGRWWPEEESGDGNVVDRELVRNTNGPFP
ncbi:uncharacterized protein LOC144083935 [Stigmatopora argus]